ncbi:MAG: hypothetical protein AAGF27_10825 [Pseudomonadota bacterium]
MSDTDSFIEEVTEEVRRDRLFQLFRRYGWIAALAILLIVGGAAFNEYRKTQARMQAEATGDAILAAISLSDAGDRLEALRKIEPSGDEAKTVVALLIAAAAVETGDREAAQAALAEVPAGGSIAPIYGQIAAFKSLALEGDSADPDSRRQQLEALATPGAPLSLLAQEQLALVAIEAGDTSEAINLYQSILRDANASADLQQRALQVIVALGGTPDLTGLPGIAN